MKKVLLFKYALIIGTSGFAQSNEAGKEWYADPVLWIGGTIFVVLLFVYILFKLLVKNGRKRKIIREEMVERAEPQAKRRDLSFDEMERHRNST